MAWPSGSTLHAKQAAELIDQYFAQYPGVRHYLDETVEFARDKGYVETVTGRRRYLRDINSRNATTRKGAERNAINTRIQGTAADMIKLAMSRIHRLLREEGFRSAMLLQVHDELVFDLHRDEVETLPPLVVREMREALPMEGADRDRDGHRRELAGGALRGTK